MDVEIKELKPSQGEAAMIDLAALSAPLVGWIRENYDPHTEIYISWDRVCIKHDSLSIPFPYSEK